MNSSEIDGNLDVAEPSNELPEQPVSTARPKTRRTKAAQPTADAADAAVEKPKRVRKPRVKKDADAEMQKPAATAADGKQLHDAVAPAEVIPHQADEAVKPAAYKEPVVNLVAGMPDLPYTGTAPDTAAEAGAERGDVTYSGVSAEGEQAGTEGANASQPRYPTERRGRGLRAIVSRTRRKNLRNGNNLSAGEKPVARHAAKVDDGHISFDDIVSGRFDDGMGGAAETGAAVNKRVLQPQPDSPKLHKVLAQAGMGSRLEMEQLILEGRISVNGEPAHIGQRIQYGDQVRVNGKTIRVQIAPPPARVLAYHKPAGEIVTRDDPQSRPTVFRKLPKLSQGKWLSIGRLDLNTEGLLLFTNSGELANSLMHPRFSIEREYAVRVLGGLSDEEKQRLLDGIELEDGRAQFKTIENGGGEGANQWYRVVICEGRNREVRRMIESLGHAVSRLIRIRYGAMVLPSNLRQGHWIELSDDELKSLGKLVGGKAMTAIQGNEPARGGSQRRSSRPGMGSGRRNSPQGSRSNPKNQPDPMKTSVGYIEHDRFITPSGIASRRSRPAGGNSAGFGAGNSYKRRNSRGGGRSH